MLKADSIRGLLWSNGPTQGFIYSFFLKVGNDIPGDHLSPPTRVLDQAQAIFFVSDHIQIER